MTKSLTEYARVNTPLPTAPKAWQPQVEQTDKGGRAENIKAPANPDDRRLMQEAGLDPDQWVLRNRKHRRWQQTVGEDWLYYWSFDFEPRKHDTAEEVRADLDEIVATILKGKIKAPVVHASDDALFVGLSDWQVGKETDYTVKGLKTSLAKIQTHVRTLRRSGRKIDTLVLGCTGDLFEGCDGHYAMQTFSVDLDRRGQTKVVRRLLALYLRELAPMFARIVVVGVGGNHGENRKDGKAFTTFSDNDDVAVLEQVQEIFAGREGFEHVEFYIADDELSACIDVKGVPVGLTHGHLAQRGGGLPQAKQKQWWGEQWWDENSPAPRAKILVTSHYHHLTVSNYGTRTHIQTPAYDGGSKWYSDISGMNSPDGVLTFVIDPAHPLGWDELKVV